jgi:hypothetical protein
MQIIRAVFEQGVELRFASDRWTISSAPPATAAVFASLSDAVAALSPLRPVLVTDKRSFGGDLTLLLRCDGKEFFGVCVSDLMNRSLSTDMLYPVSHLAYLLGAVSYHCQRLAELYAQITVRTARLPRSLGMATATTLPLSAIRRNLTMSSKLSWEPPGDRTTPLATFFGSGSGRGRAPRLGLLKRYSKRAATYPKRSMNDLPPHGKTSAYPLRTTVTVYTTMCPWTSAWPPPLCAATHCALGRRQFVFPTIPKCALRTDSPSFLDVMRSDTRGNLLMKFSVFQSPQWKPLCHVRRTRPLTNRSSQPLAVVMRTFDFMKQFSMFITLAAASGGSAPSR